MASLLSTGIVSVCVGLAGTGQYNDACNKAAEAGVRQTGFRAEIDHAEDTTVGIVNSKIQRYAPTPIQDAIGAAGFVYKTAQQRKLTFRLPTLGVCDALSNDITPSSYTLNVKWNLP